MRLLSVFTTLVLLALHFQYSIYAQPPRLAVIIVVDQFAYHELAALRASFKSGLKFLCDKGIFYTHATMPNGITKTAPGHAAIATGARAQDHGIVNNSWVDAHTHKEIEADDDNRPGYQVFSPAGLYPFGKSSRSLMVDTLSDQLILNAPHGTDYAVYSLSLKSAAAIIMAGRLGKAFWFDALSWRFTSSKAYFNALPAWLEKWNKKHVPTLTLKPKDRTVPVELALAAHADALLCNLAYECLSQHTSPQPIVLWLSLSALDYVGHVHGPDSPQVHDHIRRLDKTLGNFIRRIYRTFRPEQVLFALTADHGVAPAPEYAQAKGFTLAQRINAQELESAMNSLLDQRFGIKNLVLRCIECSIYLDQEQLHKLDNAFKNEVIATLKEFLLKQEGIQNVWTPQELSSLSFNSEDIRGYLKDQLYKDRSGQLIYLVRPYTIVTRYNKGTTHQTPYNYDTHVPLVLYQKKFLEKKVIDTPVAVTQLPVTLASLLNVPRPSAARDPKLPLRDLCAKGQGTQSSLD
jgi:hypothetical protein